MDLAQKCVAICHNYMQTKDEQQAITDALFPPLERFDVSAAGAEDSFVSLWEQIDLSTLHGFPLFEEGVFAAPIVFPMVAKGKARVRVITSASFSKADCDAGLAAFKKVKAALA